MRAHVRKGYARTRTHNTVARTHTHIHMHTRTQAYVYINAYTCARTQTYIHTHIRTNAQHKQANVKKTSLTNWAVAQALASAYSRIHRRAHDTHTHTHIRTNAHTGHTRHIRTHTSIQVYTNEHVLQKTSLTNGAVAAEELVSAYTPPAILIASLCANEEERKNEAKAKKPIEPNK